MKLTVQTAATRSAFLLFLAVSPLSYGSSDDILNPLCETPFEVDNGKLNELRKPIGYLSARFPIIPDTSIFLETGKAAAYRTPEGEDDSARIKAILDFIRSCISDNDAPTAEYRLRSGNELQEMLSFLSGLAKDGVSQTPALPSDEAEVAKLSLLRRATSLLSPMRLLGWSTSTQETGSIAPTPGFYESLLAFAGTDAQNALSERKRNIVFIEQGLEVRDLASGIILIAGSESRNETIFQGKRYKGPLMIEFRFVRQ